MLPKKRVLTTFHSQPADRVPINYLSNPGIDRRLKDHFGLKHEDDEGLRRALGVDFRGVDSHYSGPPLHADIPGRSVDRLWGIRRRYVDHGHGGYWEFCDFPLAQADQQTVADWPMPRPDDFDYSGIAAACKQHGRYAVFPGGLFGDIINGNGFLRGMEQTLIDLATDEPAGLLLADRRMNMQLEVTRRMLEAADGGFDFLWLGEDLGTQVGPMISMQLFRKHIRSRYEPFCRLARSYGIPCMIHTCGSSSWAYEEFIQMGIGVVDTLQPEARDMSPTYLKGRFGGRLAFHGCISTAGPVSFGTVQDVIRNCRQTLEIMMPGGGYCFAPTHQLQDNSPTENVLAMYETAETFGRY